MLLDVGATRVYPDAMVDAYRRLTAGALADAGERVACGPQRKAAPSARPAWDKPVLSNPHD